MFRRRLMLAAPILVPTLFAIAGCARTTATQTAPAASTVVVFFEADSAALDPAAQAAIQQAAATAKQRPNATVRVRGFAAPDSGSAAFNRSLSQTRAEGVIDALVSSGVPRIQISMETRGAVPFELMPTESRRVEIVVGP